jgi:hypothetical protein
MELILFFTLLEELPTFLLCFIRIVSLDRFNPEQDSYGQGIFWFVHYVINPDLLYTVCRCSFFSSCRYFFSLIISALRASVFLESLTCNTWRCAPPPRPSHRSFAAPSSEPREKSQFWGKNPRKSFS